MLRFENRGKGDIIPVGDFGLEIGTNALESGISGSENYKFESHPVYAKGGWEKGFLR